MPMIRVEGPQNEERSGAESTESSRGRFVAHTKRMLSMKKSSRLWWLHGAILLSAVIGCKNCGNSCGGPGGASATGTMPYGGGSPIASGGPMTYSSSSMPYQGGTASSGTPSFPAGGQTPGYSMPNSSSGLTPGAGGFGR